MIICHIRQQICDKQRIPKKKGTETADKNVNEAQLQMSINERVKDWAVAK